MSFAWLEEEKEAEHIMFDLRFVPVLLAYYYE
jgi:hypothetical protein